MDAVAEKDSDQEARTVLLFATAVEALKATEWITTFKGNDLTPVYVDYAADQLTDAGASLARGMLANVLTASKACRTMASNGDTSHEWGYFANDGLTQAALILRGMLVTANERDSSLDSVWGFYGAAEAVEKALESYRTRATASDEEADHADD